MNQIMPEAYESYMCDGMYGDSEINKEQVMPVPEISSPKAKCIAPYVLGDETIAEFSVGNLYEVAAIMVCDDRDEILLINDLDQHHYFTASCPNFKASFEIQGDVELVREYP